MIEQDVYVNTIPPVAKKSIFRIKLRQRSQ